MMDVILKHELSQKSEKMLRLLVLFPRILHSQCLCLWHPPIHPISFCSLLPVFQKGMNAVASVFASLKKQGLCLLVFFHRQAPHPSTTQYKEPNDKWQSCIMIHTTADLLGDPPLWGLIFESVVPGAKEDTAYFFWKALKPVREGCGPTKSWHQTFFFYIVENR